MKYFLLFTFVFITSVSYSQKKAVFIADSDTAFSKSTGFNVRKCNEQQIKNLDLLCKVWGFVKYYHPSIAAGKYNWDNELFRFLPKYLSVKTNEERNDSLFNWINSLGSVSGKGSKIKIKSNTKCVPNLDWISDTTVFGSKLSNLLVNIKNTSRKKQHYYFSFLENIGTPVFKNERLYKDASFNDFGFRILTVFRYYNVIEYFFPHKNAIGENWQDIPAEFIEKILLAENEIDVQKTILEMITRINDTQAKTIFNENFTNEFYGKVYANYKILFIENNAVVSGYINPSKVKEIDLKIGDIITEIDGESTLKKVERLKKYSPASNEFAKLNVISQNLLRSNNRSINVTFVRNNKISSSNVPCYPTSSLYANREVSANDIMPTWRFLTPDIGYIFLGTLENRDIPKMMRELRATSGIVIDLRCIPSDFVVFSLSQYFHIKKTAFAKFSKTNIQNPGEFTFTKPVYAPKIKYPYNGKIVILVNETTQGLAEYTAMSLESTSTATVVGSTTSGANGNVSEIILPWGISTSFSGVGVYYPDGKETQRVGIAIDDVIKPTLGGFLFGKDEALEKAVQIIKNK